MIISKTITQLYSKNINSFNIYRQYNNSQKLTHNLILNLHYYKSYWKTLKRRRKIKVKKRPVSQKILIQQREAGFSYSKQMKILDIKKRLDKKKQVNHQIYQLVQDLYFPDIRKLSYEAAQLGMQDKFNPIFRQLNQDSINKDSIIKEIRSAILATDLLSIFMKYQKDLDYINQVKQFQEKFGVFKFQQQQNQTLKNKNQMREINQRQQFELNHYKQIVDRIQLYLKDLPKIKDNYMERFQKIMNKVNNSVKNIQKNKQKQKIKCPYQFLDAQDLLLYQPWQIFLQSLHNNIYNNSPIQRQSQSSLAIKVLFDQINLILKIQNIFKQIPDFIYQLITQKIRFYFSQEKIYNIKSLTSEQLNLILKLFYIKKFVKLSQQIIIQDPVKLSQINSSHYNIVHEVIQQFIKNNQKLKIQYLQTIISLNKTSQNKQYLQPQILKKLQPVILKFLTKINFQNSVSCFLAYRQIGIFSQNDIKTEQKVIKYVEFMELLKFDLYRKVQSCKNKKSIFELLGIIKNGKISLIQHFQKNSSQVKYLQGQSLLRKVGQILGLFYMPLKNQNKVSENLLKNLFFTAKQLYKILKYLFQNGVEGKQWISHIQVLGNQIGKMINQYKLQELADIALMIRIISFSRNNKSIQNNIIVSFRILGQLIANRFIKQYYNLKKVYEEQRMYLLPKQEKLQKGSKQSNNQINEISIKQVLLQQSRVVVLWNYLIGLLIDKKIDRKLDSLLSLYPSTEDHLFSFKNRNNTNLYISRYFEPLIMQLLFQTQKILQPYQIFPKIDISHSKIKTIVQKYKNKFPNIIQKTSQNLQQFSFQNNPESFKRQWNKYYIPDFLKSKAQFVFQKQAQTSNIFIKNYNYVQNIYIPQRWSATDFSLIVKLLNNNEFKYIFNKYYSIEKYIQWMINNKNMIEDANLCYFKSNYLKQVCEIRLDDQIILERKRLLNEILTEGKAEKMWNTQNIYKDNNKSQNKQFKYYQLQE